MACKVIVLPAWSVIVEDAGGAVLGVVEQDTIMPRKNEATRQIITITPGMLFIKTPVKKETPRLRSRGNDSIKSPTTPRGVCRY